MVAVNEFAQQQRRAKSKHMGRADLHIYAANHTHIIEAKFKWISLASDFSEKLSDLALKESADSRNSSTEQEHDVGLGVAFGAA